MKNALVKGLCVILLSIVGWGQTAVAAIEEGKQYQRIEPAVIVSTEANQIEVIEFFSYGCPHCASLAPYFAAWEVKKPANIIVKKVPVEFNPAWERFSKLYYTAHALNISNKMDPVLFNAVQRGVDLNDEAVVEKLFAEQGVDPDVFKKTYDSFSVSTALEQGRFLAKQYKVMQVPQVIVDGRYKTDMGIAGGPQGLVNTLNELIAKVEEQRGAR